MAKMTGSCLSVVACHFNQLILKLSLAAATASRAAAAFTVSMAGSTGLTAKILAVLLQTSGEIHLAIAAFTGADRCFVAHGDSWDKCHSWG